jgi:hypothetical protein
MMAINPPRPTHSDMVLVQSQGRDGATVQQDLATARAAAEAIRHERELAMGPDPMAPVPIP